MANISRVRGFRPVKHITGAPYNGQANIYEIPAGETIPVFVGDLVILSNSNATEGYPAVEVASVAASATSAVIVGAVVGIINSKLDPVNGKMSNGSILLDTPQYRAASTKQFVLVADSPDLIFEAEADEAVALESVGLNAAFVGGNGTASLGSTSTGVSGMQVDASTAATTNTLPLTIVGFTKSVDNEPNATYNKVLVKINTHQYANGATGV